MLRLRESAERQTRLLGETDPSLVAEFELLADYLEELGRTRESGEARARADAVRAAQAEDTEG